MGITLKSSEYEEQKAVIQWFATQYPKLDMRLQASANGGSRHKIEAAKLKASGVLSGVFDLFLMIAKNGKHGLFIEMKRPETRVNKQGVVSVNQNAFKEIAQYEGYDAVVCYGAEDAINCIKKYLGSSSNVKKTFI